MTGGFIGVAFLIWAIFGAIPAIAIGAVGIVAMFVACYMVWRDERNKRFLIEREKFKVENDLEQNKELIRTLNREVSEEKAKRLPNIQGMVRWFSCGVGEIKKKEYTAATYLVELRNLGMPSALTDWHLIVKLAGREPFAVMPTYFGEELRLGREGLPSEIITSKDLIDKKTIEPIQTGAVIRGYLFFMFAPERDSVDLPGTVMEIRFADVTRKRYSIVESRFPVFGSDYQIPYIPGVEIKKEPLKQKRGSRKRNNSEE